MMQKQKNNMKISNTRYFHINFVKIKQINHNLIRVNLTKKCFDNDLIFLCNPSPLLVLILICSGVL